MKRYDEGLWREMENRAKSVTRKLARQALPRKRGSLKAGFVFSSQGSRTRAGKAAVKTAKLAMAQVVLGATAQ
jgi:hypothetical protein